MATRVYEQEDITLDDDTEVTLKPLPIARLRRFMDAWSKFSEAENDDDGFDVFINCAGIALEANFKGKFDSLKATDAQKKKGEYLSTEYKEYLEEVLELPTIYKVLDVCGGIKLNDPKMLAAAMDAATVTNQ